MVHTLSCITLACGRHGGASYVVLPSAGGGGDPKSESASLLHIVRRARAGDLLVGSCACFNRGCSCEALYLHWAK